MTSSAPVHAIAPCAAINSGNVRQPWAHSFPFPSAAQLKRDLEAKLHEAELIRRDLEAKLHEADLIRLELAVLGSVPAADDPSEREPSRLSDAHVQARQLLQAACTDATTDQLKAAAKAAGIPDMYASFITTCGETIPKVKTYGYGCTKAEISAACPVFCNTCPTVAPSPMPGLSQAPTPTVPAVTPVPTAVTPVPKAACEDLDPEIVRLATQGTFASCAAAAQLNYCNEPTAQTYCPKSCGLCPTAPPTGAPTPPIDKSCNGANGDRAIQSSGNETHKTLPPNATARDISCW